MILSIILLIVAASFLVTAEQEKVTLEYEEYSMGHLEETKSITLYSYGSQWYRSPLARGEPVNEVDQLKEILTDRDSALNDSEWLGSYEERRRYEMEREEEGLPVETPYGYEFESTGSIDEGHNKCTIEFTHNSTLYKVGSANIKCRYDAWRVEADGESYILASEKVTEIFSDVTNAYE